MSMQSESTPVKPGGLTKIIVTVAVGILIVVSAVFTVKVTDTPTFLKSFGVLVAAWLTFCILSFLYRDNALYKAAEHVMVGLAMGYMTVYYTFQVLKPRLWDRLVDNQLSEGDTLFGSDQVFRFALIIPAILGLLMLCRIFPKVAWISRWPMAILIGIGSGLAIPVTIQANITTQLLSGTRLPLDYMEAMHGGANFATVGGWEFGVPIMIVGTVCALMYFFFSVPHRGIIGKAAGVGIWVLMLGFGASFGYTVMARLSLFIGRVLFILKDWLNWL